LLITESDGNEYREGRLRDGASYRIHPEGIGTIAYPESPLANWSVNCGVDKIYGGRECVVTAAYDSGGPLIYFGKSNSAQQVCIIGHDFPGRTGAMRVDGNPPVRTDGEGCVSGSYVNQLATGTTLVARWVEWPYDVEKDTETSLRGLKEALSLMDFIRQNIDTLAF
jgi:hypothetical protein